MSITAPWPAEVVDALNRFQSYPYLPEFTCGWRDEHPENDGVLVARENGWYCPSEGCHYRQTWAHAFMADPATVDQHAAHMSEMTGAGTEEQ